jgi:hypothetical protein
MVQILYPSEYRQGGRERAHGEAKDMTEAGSGICWRFPFTALEERLLKRGPLTVQADVFDDVVVSHHPSIKRPIA